MGSFFANDEMPEPFVCVICGREVAARNWTRRHEHRPPICFYCGNARGHQARIPGMTRGDHRALQRLHAITDALLGQASLIEWEARHGRA